MKKRIYQGLKRALDLNGASVPNEQALLEIYTRELLELRHLVLNLFPDALVEREKLFRSEPLYLSYLVSTSAEKHQVGSVIDQLVADGHIAAWEDCELAKYPSLRWLLEKQPRTTMLPKDLLGRVFLRSIGPLFDYHLRVFPEELSHLSLRGINASTGQCFVSEVENYGVLVLNFSLDLGDTLLLWVYQCNTVVATAMIRQMAHLMVEKEEGVHIRDRDTVSGGVSLSP